jgi:hypothetical protein
MGRCVPDDALQSAHLSTVQSASVCCALRLHEGRNCSPFRNIRRAGGRLARPSNSPGDRQGPQGISQRSVATAGASESPASPGGEPDLRWKSGFGREASGLYSGTYVVRRTSTSSSLFPGVKLAMRWPRASGPAGSVLKPQTAAVLCIGGAAKGGEQASPLLAAERSNRHII